MKQNVYGLIGKSLGHSFSPQYFNEKFEKSGLSDHTYQIFEFDYPDDIGQLKFQKNIKGLNVTIPYKSDVMQHLDQVDDHAFNIGAVNTIKVVDGFWHGYNTDYLGFADTLRLAMQDNPGINRAIILGSGGASKAIQYALELEKISYVIVSRKGVYTYETISDEAIRRSNLIINTTPLGMWPDIDQCPLINYDQITEKHSCIDLVYNPEKTLFLTQCEQQGAKTYNGLNMLKSQAEHAWNIWNESNIGINSYGRPRQAFAG